MQHFLDIAYRQNVGDQLFHHGGMVLLNHIQEILHRLAPQQLVGVAFDYLRQMGNQHRRRVYHGAIQHLGLLLILRLDPQSRQAKSRFPGGDALQFRGGLPFRIQGQEVARPEIAPGDLIAFHLDDILVGRELEIVPDANGLHDDPQLVYGPAARRRNPLQEAAPLPGIRQRNQVVADLDLQQLHFNQGPEILGLLHPANLRPGPLHLQLHLLPLFPDQAVRKKPASRRQDEKGEGRDSGNKPQDKEQHRRDENDPGKSGHLPAKLFPKGGLRRGAGNQHAGGDGDHQGRDLGHQAVAHR